MKKTCFLLLLIALTSTAAACGDDSANQNNVPVISNNDSNNDLNNEQNNDSNNDLNNEQNNDSNNDQNNNTQTPALPSLTIQSPQNAEILEDATVEFQILVESGPAGGVSWKLNGGAPAQKVLDLKPGDIFTQSIEANTGLNTLEITLHTNDGRRVKNHVVFQVNAAAKPVISLSEQPDSLSYAELFELKAQILAASGLAEHNVTINNVESSDTTLTELEENEAGQSVYELVASLPLSPGTNEITIHATANNEETSSLTFSISREEDTESPELFGLFPYSGQSVQTRRATFFGTVTDNIAVQNVKFMLGDDTYDAEIDEATDKFTADVWLEPGLNEITIQATDIFENTQEITHTVYFGNRTTSGGAHGGAIVDGKLYAWGRNQLGQVGLGFVSTPPAENHPDKATHVVGLENVVSIAFNQNGSIALTDDGSVYGWSDNGKGQLCLGKAGQPLDTINRHAPEKVTELTEPIVAVTRGYSHTLLLTASGTVLACGDNSAGQIGDGTTENRDIPTPVQGLTDIIGIVGGSASSYAIAADGTVYAWGRNSYANLGNGPTHTNPTPIAVPVEGLSGVIGLASGRDHVIAITRTHELYGWGLNASNQVGENGIGTTIGNNVTLPVLLNYNDGKPTQVRANGNQSFLFATDGRAYGWGQNGSGNLGVPVSHDLVGPGEPVFGLENISDLGIGALQGVAMRADGRVFSWGWSFQGSLGGGSSIIDRWGYRIPVLVEFAQ